MTQFLRLCFVLVTFGVLTACGGTFSDPVNFERGNSEMVGGGGVGPSGGAASDGEGGPGGQPR